MPRAKLTLTIPEGVWIGDISRESPEATFRVLSALPGEDSGVGLLEVSAPDLVAVLREMEERDEVIELEPLGRTDESVLVQFETSEPLLLEPMQGSGVPIEMPFEIVEGRATWEVTAPQDRISALGEQLDAFGIEFTVEGIHQHLAAEQFLTDRQRRLVETAVELGYYDTPRECSLTDLADDLGIAKSTCSETLHRAEGKIIKQFVAEEPGEALLRPSG
ncbi:MAG: helix-turn-helix domain-containing protein [Halobacteriales archaeon]